MNKLLKVLIVFVGLFSFITVNALDDSHTNLDNVVVTDNANSKGDYSNKVVYHNPETGFDSFIIDEENLITDADEKRLADDMQPLTKYGGIAFISAKCSYSTESCIQDYYRKLFSYESGSVFLIDMENRNIYIFSDGSNYSVITTEKAELITDNIYKLATAGDYYSCASKAFKQMYTLFSGGKIAEPMKHIVNGLISLFLGFLICFIVAARTFSNKRNNDRVKNNYVKNLAISNFAAVVSGQHRIYNPPSSSGGSSGGGGGGGGGGGSSGGGGGHGF